MVIGKRFDPAEPMLGALTGVLLGVHRLAAKFAKLPDLLRRKE